MKYAIFYFSPCGGTKSVADIISKELGAAPMQELTTPSMKRSHSSASRSTAAGYPSPCTIA